MKRVGRKYGFIIGTGIGLSGATITTISILYNEFIFFCMGTFVRVLLGRGEMEELVGASAEDLVVANMKHTLKA